MDPKHLEIVRKGAKAIDRWRKKNVDKEILDLSNADLAQTNLKRTNLELANLDGAELVNANLDGTSLFNAHLNGANLAGAQLINTNLDGAELVNANLTKALLYETNLLHTDLTKADLTGATIYLANLTNTNLTDAKLLGSSIAYSYFRGIGALNTNLQGSRIIGATFVDCDITQIKGLDTITHEEPSSIGIDTIEKTFRSLKEKSTPELNKTVLTFFVNTGVPREFLDAFPKILADVKYRTAFIAYGEPDVSFARKLHDDLINNRVSCWLYKTDKTIGERTWREISIKRREAEKMIVICSAKSLIRDGLLKELEEQVDEDPEKLIPISLDELWKEKGFLVMREGRNLKPYILDRNYADFCSGFDYKENFDKLLRALKKN